MFFMNAPLQRGALRMKTAYEDAVTTWLWSSVWSVPVSIPIGRIDMPQRSVSKSVSKGKDVRVHKHNARGTNVPSGLLHLRERTNCAIILRHRVNFTSITIMSETRNQPVPISVASITSSRAKIHFVNLARSLVISAIVLGPVVAIAEQTAQARMYCFSPRFQRAEDQSSFFTLELTTLSWGVNGELAFGDFFGTGYSHSTFLILTDQLFGDQYEGAMALDVPTGGDANENTYPDFFEVIQPVNATSSGGYNVSGIGSGSVTASWARDGGSQLGLCVLTLRNSWFGNLVFSPTFELIEYAGPLCYTPGSNIV